MALDRMFKAVMMAGSHRQHGTPEPGASQRLAASPVVSTLPRAAELFGLEPTRLAQAVAEAGLVPWPWRHADGSQVWHWRDLCRVAAQLGVPVRPAKRLRTRVQQKRQRRREQRQGGQL